MPTPEFHRGRNQPGAARRLTGSLLACAVLPGPAALVASNEALGLTTGDVVFTAVVGFAIALAGLRTWRLAGAATGSAALAAATCLALVFYVGAVEVLGFGLAEPRLGGVDSTLLGAPAIVFVYALTASIRVGRRFGPAGAGPSLPESSQRLYRDWPSYAPVAALAAACLTPLALSEALDLQRVGVLGIAGITAAIPIVLVSMRAALEGSRAPRAAPAGPSPSPRRAPPAPHRRPIPAPPERAPIHQPAAEDRVPPAHAALRAKLRALRAAARRDA